MRISDWSSDVCSSDLPAQYRSVSAFSPIVAPAQVPWGEKAFTGYLGPDRSMWKTWDATVLAAGTDWRRPVLIDQGPADGFLETQLKTQLLANACGRAGVPLTRRRSQERRVGERGGRAGRRGEATT